MKKMWLEKKERDLKGVLKPRFSENKLVLITKNFATIIPNVRICARHRLVLFGVFRIRSYERFHFFS